MQSGNDIFIKTGWALFKDGLLNPRILPTVLVKIFKLTDTIIHKQPSRHHRAITVNKREKTLACAKNVVCRCRIVVPAPPPPPSHTSRASHGYVMFYLLVAFMFLHAILL